jgi:hypothetical protein
MPSARSHLLLGMTLLKHPGRHCINLYGREKLDLTRLRLLQMPTIRNNTRELQSHFRWHRHRHDGSLSTNTAITTMLSLHSRLAPLLHPSTDGLMWKNVPQAVSLWHTPPLLPLGHSTNE